MKTCGLCQHTDLTLHYSLEDIPIFQNKVYDTLSEAKNVATHHVTLESCHHCHFVSNTSFDNSKMQYDQHYQNEQAHSVYYQHHLNKVKQIFIDHSFHQQNLIEIGCGKGYLLNLLHQDGFNILGFDPAYVGDHPSIINDYFSAKYTSLNADVIVLRHVLEHIERPLDFLHQIAQSVNYNAKIYIEVPSLDWILANHAFWDIFYEHCNYFSYHTLSGLFTKCELGTLFDGQYMYVVADLKDLKTSRQITTNDDDIDFTPLKNRMHVYQDFINHYSGALVWGAGAKGVTFLNILDKHKQFIANLVDINPVKQAKYIPKTGHTVISPDELNQFIGQKVIIMNDNYFSEIKNITDAYQMNLFKLSDVY